MIFATVGTHEQQFNRLVKELDDLVKSGIINEEVMIQSGYSTYKPIYCRYKELLSYDEMIENIVNARIVITHGGPASFLQVLQNGKIPIVIPREKEYDEHINNHQLEFAELVKKTQRNIILVKDIRELKDIIKDYDSIIDTMPREVLNNNIKFNKEFTKIIDEIINE